MWPSVIDYSLCSPVVHDRCVVIWQVTRRGEVCRVTVLIIQGVFTDISRDWSSHPGVLQIFGGTVLLFSTGLQLLPCSIEKVLLTGY